MNIHEYQAKQLFRQYAVPVPEGDYATSSETARQVAESLPADGWVIKAQVHAGARGKAGGVKFAKTLDEVAEHTEQLLGTRLVTI